MLAATNVIIIAMFRDTSNYLSLMVCVCCCNGLFPLGKLVRTKRQLVVIKFAN